MNCFNHPEAPAAAYCRTCGKALCEDCRRVAGGTIFCEEHLPAFRAEPAGQSAAVSPASDCSPGLACLLGFIPGVGAIYNGQYAKGLVHAVIFGLLVSIESSGAAGGLEPLFGVLIAAWVFYMALEAYHTARKRRAGLPVDEFSSLFNIRGEPGRFPVGAITLIVLGAILLLNTMGFLEFRYIVRYWPVLLILIGVYMLYGRVTSHEGGAR
ncbi:MAG TPA: DUF5668 domain-containing protein [Bryobacteraceae bacterium]|nr:DUF5668 domain-containing protein [Bryobacteraceae bacterium]